jgi:two-component system response regulator
MKLEDVEILLVEDNPSDVMLTLHAFEKNNITNKVHVATDGAEALGYLLGAEHVAGRSNNHKLKTILLDLKLAKVDGLEVLRRIRTDKRTCHIPVVVLTSSNEDRDIVESYNLGVNSYLRKPVDFENFTEAARLIGLYWLLLNVPQEQSLLAFPHYRSAINSVFLSI